MAWGGFIYDSDNQSDLIAFVGSLAFHALVILYFSYAADLQDVSKQDTPMEIVFTEPKNKFQMAQAQNNQNVPDLKKKKEVKFKSDRTRRTELETVARPTPAREQRCLAGYLMLYGPLDMA